MLIHPWESGRDNAVEWDAPLWRVMPEVTVVHRRDTHSVDAAERPTDEHYRRFLSLVRRGTEAEWAQMRLARAGAFRVLDPGFSGILARACHDLAWLAERLGEPRVAEESSLGCERVAAALGARADSDGLIRALDMTDESTLEVTSAGSALAALAPSLEDAQVRAVGKLVTSGALASPYGVRSLIATTPSDRRGTTGGGRLGRTSRGCPRGRSNAGATPTPPRSCAGKCSPRWRVEGCASTSCPTRGVVSALATSPGLRRSRCASGRGRRGGSRRGSRLRAGPGQRRSSSDSRHDPFRRAVRKTQG